jgi:hypothetical protein
VRGNSGPHDGYNVSTCRNDLIRTSLLMGHEFVALAWRMMKA